ncbi:transcription activator MBF2 domain-containing protein [Phthorimaea operculella]|nr:transcription activator MBF2 domain-containing protein [Phthorimaea operculella]
MRAITLLTFFCILAAASSQSHNFYIGTASYGDVVLYKSVEVKYAFPFFVRTTDVKFPEPGKSSYAIITAIYVHDNYNDGSGGYATIRAGGVGQRFVNVHLKSQRGGGFNFTVTIYGRYY